MAGIYKSRYTGQQIEVLLEKATSNPPYIGENGNWYVYDNEAGQYEDSGVSAQGPAGAQGNPGPKGDTGGQGPAGPKGEDGNSFVVLGLYPTLSALETAHPAGSPGDAYAVGDETDNTIYIWDVDSASWRNMGAMQGPPGPAGADGNPGADGLPGTPGVDGKSAYQSALDGGYTGTEEEFNEILATAQSQIGILTNLTTTEKSNLVGAITEVNTSLSWEDILRNSDFVNPINQRGVSGTISALGYFIDCWKLTNGTVTLTANGLQLNGTIVQIFEKDAPNTSPLLGMHSGTATASYDNGTKTLSITSGGGVIKYVNKPFSDYGAERAKCQRYYVRLNYLSSNNIGNATYAGSWLNLSLSLPTSLRLQSPTINITCNLTKKSDSVALGTPTHTKVYENNLCIGWSGTQSVVATPIIAGQNGYIEVIADL